LSFQITVVKLGQENINKLDNISLNKHIHEFVIYKFMLNETQVRSYV